MNIIESLKKLWNPNLTRLMGVVSIIGFSIFHFRSKKLTLKSDNALRALGCSEPEFNNVLLLRKTDFLDSGVGSAVYIGNNLLITNAHNVFDQNYPSSKNKRYLKKFTVNQVSPQGVTINSYNVDRIYIHPEYAAKRGSAACIEKDIAVVHIRGSIDLPGIQPHLEPTENFLSDAIAVGYPRLTGPKDKISYPFLPLFRDNYRRAVEVPHCIFSEINDETCHAFVNNIGFDLKIKEDKRSASLIKRPKNILENGTQQGMSGGLLFWNKKFVAIPTLIYPTSIASRLKLSLFNNRSSGDWDIYVPLQMHKEWLQSVIENAEQDTLEMEEAHSSSRMISGLSTKPRA